MAVSRLLFAALIVLGLIWGGSFYFIKRLLEDFEPWTIAFLRSGFGCVTVAAVMLILGKKFELRAIRWLPLAVVAMVNTAVPWALIGIGETRLSSGLASILNATTPLWTIAVGALFFKAATNRMQWVGMVLAMAGIVILLDIDPRSFAAVDFVGFACMLAAALCYAFGSQLSKRLKDVTLYQTTFGTLLCSTLGSGAVALAVEPVNLSPVASLTNIGLIVGLGVFGSGIAYILFFFMIQQGSPEFATMVTYLVPATAVLWGFTLLNEPVHWSLFAGLIFILGGVFVSGRKRRRQGTADI